MNGHLRGEVTEGSDDASSLLAMNVSAIQAMPKSAIIATMPEVKIDMFGMSTALTLRTADQRRSRQHHHLDDGGHGQGLDPAVLSRIVGLGPSNRPKKQITTTAPRKIATLRLA